jgi:hypothetical protein
MVRRDNVPRLMEGSMKRLVPLALIVFALAAVPVAFGDDAPPSFIPTTPTATTPAAPAQKAGHAPLRLEILRLRLQLAQVRYQIACHDQSSDRCTQFTQKAVDRLTTLDGNVQSKLDDLKCTTDSTDRKCAVLTKLDAKLQDVLAKLGA